MASRHTDYNGNYNRHYITVDRDFALESQRAMDRYPDLAARFARFVDKGWELSILIGSIRRDDPYRYEWWAIDALSEYYRAQIEGRPLRTTHTYRDPEA